MNVAGIILPSVKMTLKDYLLRTYGHETTALTVGYDRCMMKIAKFKNHVVFSARCKKAGVTPPSLRIRSPIDTERGRAIAERTSRQFLDERLRVANFRLRKLEDERKWREIGLQRSLSTDDFTQVRTLSEEKSEKIFLEVRRKQVEKFSKFTQSAQSGVSDNGWNTTDPTSLPDKSRWVLNLSKHRLTDTERTALERGFNFADTPKTIPKDNIVAGVEAALRKCNDEREAERARSAIANILRSAKPPKSTTTAKEHKAFRNLMDNECITILPADKGNATVVIDTDEYERKAEDILGKPPFKKIARNPTRRNEKRVNDGLKRLLDKSAIDKETYNSLRVSTAGTQPPCFYGTVKIHKPDKPLRPIVSAIGSATYSLSRFVSRILTPYTRTARSFIMNTDHFRELLSEIHVSEEEMLVSFDVKSLFTSVPVNDAIAVIRDIINTDKNFETHAGISSDTLLEMVRICLGTTSFQFRNEHYELTDGLAMGSPLSPCVANLFMAKLEETALANADLKKPTCWFRFVDDVFSIIRKDAVESFLLYLNQQHPAIQFTMEVEKDRKLPFLDITVCRQVDGRLATNTYRKPTHTGRFLQFDSNHPASVKNSVALSLLKRVGNITESDEAKHREIEQVVSELSANGYPLPFLRRAQRKAHQWETSLREATKTITVPKAADDKTNITATIPYVRGTSEGIRRVLAKLGIKTAFTSRGRKWSLMRGAKDKLPADTQPGVVYALGCADCELVYVGETTRTAKERLKEHKCHTRMGKTELSAVAHHVAETGHSIHWHARILAKDQRTSSRKIKEALVINRLDKNKKRTMNHDSGIQLSRLWLDVLGV